MPRMHEFFLKVLFWKMEDGRWKMGDGRRKMEDGRWEMEDGRWKIRVARYELRGLLDSSGITKRMSIIVFFVKKLCVFVFKEV